MRIVRLSSKRKKYIEKQFLIYSLGIIQGVKHKVIDSKMESFSLLFKPFIIAWLRKKRFSKNLIDIIDKGREMGDVFDMVPHTFDAYIDELMELILLELSKLQDIDIISDVSWFNNFIDKQRMKPSL